MSQHKDDFSEFWFRSYRVAKYSRFGKYVDLKFDTNDESGLASCNMPGWVNSDIKLLAEWLLKCASTAKSDKLPESVELI